MRMSNYLELSRMKKLVNITLPMITQPPLQPNYMQALMKVKDKKLLSSHPLIALEILLINILGKY